MAPARLGNPSDDPQHSRAHRHPRYSDGTDTPTSTPPVQSAGPSASRPATATRPTGNPVKAQTERLFECLHASCLALDSLHASGGTSTLKDNPLYLERVATLLSTITPVPLHRLLSLEEARGVGRVGAPDANASRAGDRLGTKGSGTDSLVATRRSLQLVRADEGVVGGSTEARPTTKTLKRVVEDERRDKLGARSGTTATLEPISAVSSDASTSSSNTSFCSAVSDNPRAETTTSKPPRASTSATEATPSPAAPHLLKSPINRLLHKKSSTSFTLIKSRSMTHLAPVTAPPVRHRGTVHLLYDYSTPPAPSSSSNDPSMAGFSRSEVGYTRALKGYFGKSLGGAMDSVKVEVNEGKDALEIYTGDAESSVRDRSNTSKANLPTNSDEWSKALHLGSRHAQQSTRREPVFFRRAEEVNLICCIRMRANNFQTMGGSQYDANSDPHLRFAQRQIQQLPFIHDAHISFSDSKTFAYRTIRVESGSDDAGSTEENESRTEWLVFSTTATSIILQSSPSTRFRWPMVYRWSTVEKSCEWVISFNLLRDGA